MDEQAKANECRCEHRDIVGGGRAFVNRADCPVHGSARIETACIEDDASYRARLKNRMALFSSDLRAISGIDTADSAQLDYIGERLRMPRWTTKQDAIALDEAELERHDHEMHELACCVRQSVRDSPVFVKVLEGCHRQFVEAKWLTAELVSAPLSSWRLGHTHDGTRAAHDWIRSQYRECANKIPKASIEDRVELIEHGKWCRQWIEDVYGIRVGPNTFECHVEQDPIRVAELVKEKLDEITRRGAFKDGDADVAAWANVAVESNKSLDKYLRELDPDLPEHYGMPVDGVRWVFEKMRDRIVDNARTTMAEVCNEIADITEDKLARAMFDVQLHEEASRIAEHEQLDGIAMLHDQGPLMHSHGHRRPYCRPEELRRVLDIMWERTKPDSRAANERFAKTIMEAMIVRRGEAPPAKAPGESS